MYRTAGVSAVCPETSCSRQTFSSIVWGGVVISWFRLYGSLRYLRGSSPFFTRAGACLGELDAIDHFEEGLGARLDDVGAHARAAVAALVVIHVHNRLALGIFTFRYP